MTTAPAAASHPAVKRAEVALGVILALLSGVALAVQSRINGELGARLGDGVLAALISFGGGLALLCALVPAVPRARVGVLRVGRALRGGDLRLWQCLGGFGGASLVAAQGLTVGALGVAVFTVAVVAGQTGSSLLVDRSGLGPGGRQPLTWPRVAGATLTLLAVAWAMSDRLDGPAVLLLIALPLLAGCAIAVQQAVNGQVRAAADSALTATLLNFLTGTTALVLAWLVVWAQQGAPLRFPAEPWLYVGGPLGIVFIAIAAMVVRWTGVLLYGLSAIAGQLVGAVALDLAVPAPGVRLQLATLVGTGVALAAVAVAALPGARIGRAPSAAP